MPDMRFGLRLPPPMLSLPNPQRVRPQALRQNITNGLRQITRGKGFITHEVIVPSAGTGRLAERYRIRSEYRPNGEQVPLTTHRLFGPGISTRPDGTKTGWEIAARVDKPVSSRTDAAGNTVETFRKRSSNKRHSFEVETTVTRDALGNEISRVCETVTPYKGKLKTDGLYDRYHRHSATHKTRLPHGGMSVEQQLEEIAYMPGIDPDKVKKVDSRHIWDRITRQKPKMVSADPLMEVAVEAASGDLLGIQRYERVKQSDPLNRHQSVDTGFISHFNDETLDNSLQEAYSSVAPRRAVRPSAPGQSAVEVAQEGSEPRHNVYYSRSTTTVPTTSELMSQFNQRLQQMPLVRLAAAPLALPGVLWHVLNRTAEATMNATPRVWRFPGYAVNGTVRGVAGGLSGAGRGIGNGLAGLARAGTSTIGGIGRAVRGARRRSVNAASNTLSAANRTIRRVASGTGHALTAPVRWTQRLANTITRRGGGGTP